MTATLLDRSSRRDSLQTLTRVEAGRESFVIKRYAARRSALRRVLRQLGHWTFAGKSATGPRGRRDTEARSLALWNAHGLDVMRVITPPAPLHLPGPWLALEYLEGRTLYEILCDPAVSEPEKLHLLRRFAPEWARRHALAIRARVPGLLHEHGTFRHVFVAGARLVTFDLETRWTRRGRTLHLAGREIAAFLRSLGRAGGANRPLFLARLAALVDAYGDRGQWLAAVRAVIRPRHPIWFTLGVLERSQRRRDPYAPARVLADAERAAAGGGPRDGSRNVRSAPRRQCPSSSGR